MPKTDTKQFYYNKLTSYNNTSRKLKKKSKILSLTRLGIFISYAITLYFFLTTQNIEAIITISLLFPTAFIAVFILYEKNKRKLSYFKKLAQICQDELNAINGDFSAFDSGKEFISNKHYYSYDLDIFGENSIFKSLNRTVTNYGKTILANYLTTPNTNKDEITNLQKSIKELSLNPESALKFRATGMETEDAANDKQAIQEWANSDNFVSSSQWRKTSMYIIPAINIALITLCSFGYLSFNLVILFATLLFLISGYNIRRINKIHNNISKKNKTLQKYHKLLNIIGNQEAKTPLIMGIKEDIKSKNDNAHKELKKLSSLISALDNRLNIMLGVILNIIFLYDFHILYRMEKWKNHNKTNIPKWFNAIGKMDALYSMSTYAYNNPNHIYPTPGNECILNATEMGHPLIPDSARINNNISITQTKEILIITGPNMAGKSTFLRTVGVNLILAMSGLPVSAKTFSFKPMNIYSSMRTTDSLGKNESYFHAELKRLSTLIKELKKGKSFFVILDELLKGTNSQDKLNGSREFIKNILNYNSTGMIATHDLPLTDMENTHPNNIRNKCFEVEIAGNNILFDYKLKDGITRNMNASILMKQMDIIE